MPSSPIGLPRASLPLCSPHCPLCSAHMSLPYPWTPTALVFHDGEPEGKKFAQGHTAKKKKLKSRLEVPAWALLGPLVSLLSRDEPFPHTSFML